MSETKGKIDATGRATVRLPDDIHKMAKHAATDRDESLQDFISHAVREMVRTDQEKPGIETGELPENPDLISRKKSVTSRKQLTFPTEKEEQEPTERLVRLFVSGSDAEIGAAIPKQVKKLISILRSRNELSIRAVLPNLHVFDAHWRLSRSVGGSTTADHTHTPTGSDS